MVVTQSDDRGPLSQANSHDSQKLLHVAIPYSPLMKVSFKTADILN